MSVIKSRCPVPPEQLPINQYEDMRDSWFYSWGGRSFGGYLKPVVMLWVISWIISGPIVAASFKPGRYPLPFVLLASAGALTMPMLALAQLYVGWLHVGQRLQQDAVPYEESGWYDGQVWQKPEDVLNRDRLIMDYQVKPILQKVRNTLGALLGLGVGLVTVWQFL
ncbi:CGLD27 family protein [Oscillatoria sp. CS-180]|nr:CGLD27 family protein [Oscillatoria sp. CS-180]